MTPLSQVEQVALYLGKPWKFNRLCESSSWRFEIIDGNGRGLYFRIDGNKFSVSGIFPRGKTMPCHNDYKTIGLSISRPARDIAADIQRRLIPCYLEAYEKALKQYQNAQAKEERLDLIAQTIIKVMGGRLGHHSRTARTIYFENGEAEIWSSEEITLKLRNLSIDQAIQAATAIKKGG